MLVLRNEVKFSEIKEIEICRETYESWSMYKAQKKKLNSNKGKCDAVQDISCFKFYGPCLQSCNWSMNTISCEVTD